MTPHDSQEPPAAGTLPGIFSIGPWVVRPLPILRRHRTHLLQEFTLQPPQGFAGTATLGVIAHGARAEFSSRWSAGDETPLLFSVPAGDAGERRPYQADLLLETGSAATSAVAARAPALLTGALHSSPPRSDQSILVALIFATLFPEETHASSQRAGRIAAAVRFLEGDHTLRLALPADCVPALREAHLESRVGSLVGTGRLDILAGSEPSSWRAPDLALPFPPRVALWTESLSALHLGDLPETASGLILAHPAPPPTRTTRLIAEERRILACWVGAADAVTPLPRAGEPAAAMLVDRILRSRAWLPAIHEGPGRSGPPVPALLWWAGPGSGTHPGRFIRGWNRHHVSPKLIAATPADCFAALAAWEARGTVIIPEVEVS